MRSILYHYNRLSLNIIIIIIMKNKKGFTLVEIMIVVVIIGLLAAMAIPAFEQVRKTSTEKAALNDLRQLAGAADQYFLEYNATSVNQTSLVTTYIRTLRAGNSYPTVITTSNTQITATTPFGTVAFSM
jgi:type IV pilus assembly protein PilA